VFGQSLPVSRLSLPGVSDAVRRCERTALDSGVRISLGEHEAQKPHAPAIVSSGSPEHFQPPQPHLDVVPTLGRQVHHPSLAFGELRLGKPFGESESFEHTTVVSRASCPRAKDATPKLRRSGGGPRLGPGADAEFAGASRRPGGAQHLQRPYTPAFSNAAPNA
jgi:hypothetical protein